MMNMLTSTAPFAWNPPLPNPQTGTSWMYPICIILGFITAIVLACLKMWKRYRISTEPFYWFILIGVPLAIFGANFGSCVLGEPAGKPWSQFWTRFGQGLAIEWGVLFVVVGAFIYFPLILKLPRYRVRDEFGKIPEVKKTSFWMYADAIMPCILIAQFIGRWGNYCNQEVYGAIVTDKGMIGFLEKVLPGMYIEGEWRQPLFFWEGIGNLAMFFILYFGVEYMWFRKAGDMGAGYVLWYGLFRICLEPLRDSQFMSNTTIIFSAIFIALGFFMILYNHLLMSKVRDKKIWHTLIYKGPKYACQMVNHAYLPWRIRMIQRKISRIKNENKVNKLRTKETILQNKYNQEENKYKLPEYAQCVRKPSELIYFGRW